MDVQIGPGRYLYGGNKRNDEKAMKSARNERRGLLNYYQCNQTDLNYPFIVLINYRYD
jgi:hypothetical protein